MKKKFTVDDLLISLFSISVPSLTERVVSERFAQKLSDKIEECGLSVDFVSLDDMGFISVNFREMTMTDHHIQTVLKCLNK